MPILDLHDTCGKRDARSPRLPTIWLGRRSRPQEDSVLLWKSVVSNPLLARTNIVLFLNKCDILTEKLKAGVPFARFITSYGTRPNDYESVSTCACACHLFCFVMTPLCDVVDLSLLAVSCFTIAVFSFLYLRTAVAVDRRKLTRKGPALLCRHAPQVRRDLQGPLALAKAVLLPLHLGRRA